MGEQPRWLAELRREAKQNRPEVLEFVLAARGMKRTLSELHADPRGPEAAAKANNVYFTATRLWPMLEAQVVELATNVELALLMESAKAEGADLGRASVESPLHSWRLIQERQRAKRARSEKWRSLPGSRFTTPWARRIRCASSGSPP